jgi:hypothetical protein
MSRPFWRETTASRGSPAEGEPGGGGFRFSVFGFRFQDLVPKLCLGMVNCASKLSLDSICRFQVQLGNENQPGCNPAVIWPVGVDFKPAPYDLGGRWVPPCPLGPSSQKKAALKTRGLVLMAAGKVIGQKHASAWRPRPWLPVVRTCGVPAVTLAAFWHLP